MGPELLQRAEIHAALGEPARLAIADALALRDLAPKELGAMFDLPTNLLAHHLDVLEDARLVVRRRSEGDRRRTYVHLLVEEPVVERIVWAEPVRHPPAYRVVFVCTHNSARSQLAAAEWQRVSHVPVASAGTHPAPRVHPRAVAVGRRHRLAIGRRATAHVDDVLDEHDLVVAVCDQAHEELVADARAKDSLHWSIPDPVRVDTDAAFDRAFLEIKGRVHRLAAALPDAT
jgi:protein-tyrosine-phosphatase/DNA-binding transcriptional ArsR family regulator